MIKVDIKRNNGLIQEVVVRDHAGYGESGKDLVCAGVSCIAIGTLNALDQRCQDVCELEMKRAYIRINVNLLDHHDAQVMLDTMILQLVTMQETYESFIKITDQEVSL